MTTADRPSCGLTFSLVVNTIDRAGPLRTLLRALEHQSFPHFEVIVVVGPTRDNTLEMLSEYEGRVRVLRCPEANLSQSRNLGLLAARGDIVAFIDDDAVPCQRWLEQLAHLFEDPNLDATGGVVYLVNPREPLLQHRIGIVSSLAEQVDVRDSWLEHVVPPGEGYQWIARMMGTNMAFRRQALLEIGGFDEFHVYVVDDADVALRLTNTGKIVHPVKEAPVYHVPASSRNRTVFTYEGRWWLQTRSGVYFSIKNGLAAGDRPRAILLRCLHLVHGHWLWYRHLRREGDLTLPQFLKMGALEIRGALSGAVGGLFRSPRLIDQSIESPNKESEPIIRFQNSKSTQRPSVDPVSGHQPSISMPDPPLRICLLSGTYPPAQYDGVGRQTNLMARGLFERGHAVHVISRGEKETVSFYDGAYVHRIPYRLDRYDRFYRFSGLHHALNYSHAVYEKVRRLMLNDGIQFVDSPIWQFEGLVTAVSDVVPVIVRLQTALRQIAAIQNSEDADTRLIGGMERLLVERADHLVPNSQAIFDAVRRVYGVSPADERCTVVPIGIAPVSEENIRPYNPGRETDRFAVLYVGRLEKRKGIQDLFQAIPKVLNEIPNVQFVVAGSDNSQHDGFFRRTGMDYPMHFVSHYRNLTSNVKFLGEVPEETLQHLYQSCDLFVAPSLYESFGLVYLEAMNYAKPVVACHTGGVPEVVDHGVTGLLVEPEAPAALAEAIVSLLRSPDKLHDMGMAGRHRLLDKFTYIQMARNTEEVYRRALRTFRASSSNE